MKLVAKTDIGSQRSENQDSYRGGAARTTLFGVPCATVWAVRAAAAWPAPWRWMRCSRPSRRVLTRRTPRRPDAHCWKAPWSRPTAAFMKRRGARLRSAHGHHCCMRAGARRPCAVCACGRFPHLSVPQQQAASAYKRPFHGAGDGGAGRADGGGSSESSAQEPHHPALWAWDGMWRRISAKKK